MPVDLPWLYSINPLVLFAGFVASLLAAGLLGRRIGQRLRAGGATPEDHGMHGLDGATLALLALLIGFTLAMALSRYEARRAGVLAEANAIGTTWLRVRMQPEPYRGELDRLLHAYVQARLDLIRTGDFRKAVARSNALQEALWTQATTLAGASTQPIMASLFIQSLNETIDLQQTRITEATNRIPTAVFVLLAVVAAVGTGFSAYSGGLAGNRAFPADVISSVLLAIVIVTIFDLDNPVGGFIRVSQEPMLSLATGMGLPTH